MIRLLRERLVLKLGVLTLVTVAAGFLGATAIATSVQRRDMERQTRRTATLYARGLASGIRSTMLTGNPLATREMLAAASGSAYGVRARVFAPMGDEVFAPPPPPPDPASLPAALRAVLAGAAAQRTPSGTLLVPIEHEERCTPCHEAADRVRGVLELGAGGAARPAEDATRAREVLAAAVRSGFVQIMTARPRDRVEDAVNEYFAELPRAAPEVSGVAALSRRGHVFFGDENLADGFADATEDAFAHAVSAQSEAIFTTPAGALSVTPLENEQRCWNCHDHQTGARGALALATRAEAVSTAALEESLGRVSELSIRHIMLSGLGRLMAAHLDDVARTGALGTLRLYDPKGRVYHDAFAHRPPPPLVAAALAGQSREITTLPRDGHEQFTYVQSLANAPECQRCHGVDRPVRGALEIVVDTSEAATRARELARNASVFALGTMLAVFLALYLALQAFVLRPVKQLSDVAERVGAGNLDVEARISSLDEVGRLGLRLNEMVVGLRQKLHLSKFVSRGTLSAVAETGAKMGLGGERRHVVVLFSDVRGFTSFSEKREPEEVVAMLNAYLEVQAQVVHRHGGDIDKFVGDELMALFFGEGAEARAALCAVEMVEAVDALNRARGVEDVAVGVGINAGPAIVGAMGSADRMDYTAIGDTVNLGARLCGNAGRGQVLVSEAVRVGAGGAGAGGAGEAVDVVFEPLEPIAVKGKAQPVNVFAARRRADAAAVEATTP